MWNVRYLSDDKISAGFGASAIADAVSRWSSFSATHVQDFTLTYFFRYDLMESG